MKIFKFGGASIKDALGVKNIAHILHQEGASNCLLVISAMGKMTNAFENIVNSYVNNDQEKLTESIDFTINYHTKIISDLFQDEHEIHQNITILFGEMIHFLAKNIAKEYDYLYDQIVCYGELLSTTIVSEYLTDIGVTNTWKDVRKLVITDAVYRDATLNWLETEQLIKTQIDSSKLTIVQGFIGGHSNGNTTTLGREGSDYTAGIFAYCLDAKNVTIWKDVLGVLNADPREFKETQLLNHISYEETIEMAFYGASVIHPKTIKPIQNKQIPLYVRSFNDLNSPGTKVSSGITIDPIVPCFIVKKNQVLISISTRDFSFMVEDNISDIFKLLHTYQLRVNLIQNSAISFSVCVDNRFNHFDQFYDEIKLVFKASFIKGVDLYTVRHFTNNSLNKIHNLGRSILSQINKNTAQIIIQKK
ncbi:aspartate kinase [Flavobacteriaceae bacterium]|nr:aspartate kinase [Flavobacteriaceae bacterium]MDA9327822.1 aspartate kinase [Flavobacteriaceae bacterium]MDB4236771.1 aspartate kinase [Flavobacteriaceae bacterium]